MGRAVYVCSAASLLLAAGVHVCVEECVDCLLLVCGFDRGWDVGLVDHDILESYSATASIEEAGDFDGRVAVA